jgi:hypothetical protein
LIQKGKTSLKMPLELKNSIGITPICEWVDTVKKKSCAFYSASTAINGKSAFSLICAEHFQQVIEKHVTSSMSTY